MDPLPKKIGDYDVIDRLGKGSFGTVYHVRNSSQQNLAIKVIHEEHSSDKSVQMEINVLRKVNHPFILAYKDSFKESTWCIVTELCEKKSLRHLLQERERMDPKEKHFREEEILEILGMIVLAVEYLHSWNPPLIHRDLKPDNILFKNCGAVKLADFGLSKFLDKQATFSCKGTLVFMAPEILAKCKPSPNNEIEKYNEKCDIYSLGIVLLGMCNLNNTPERSQKKIPGQYSMNLYNLIQSMLEEQPELRPSASEIKNRDFMQPSMQKVNERLRNMGYSASELSDLCSPSGSYPVQSTSEPVSGSVDSGFSPSVACPQSCGTCEVNEVREELKKVLLSKRESANNKVFKDVTVTVNSCVYSNATKTVYSTDGTDIHCSVWDGERLLLQSKTVRNKADPITSMAMASSSSSTEDSLYISAGRGKDKKKNLFRISGPNFKDEKKLDLDGIKEECDTWIITSDTSPNTHTVLLVHPSNTNSIYLFTLGMLRKIVLQSASIRNYVTQMQMVGDKVILGNSGWNEVDVFDIVMQDDQCKIDGSRHWKSSTAYYGTFAALKSPSDPKDFYVITKTGATEVSAFEYGDRNAEIAKTVDTKMYMLPLLGVINQKSSQGNLSVLIVGKNDKGCLCAIEVKLKRKRLSDKAPQKSCSVM